LRRSLVRGLTRRRLYNGNVERMSTWVRASHPLRIVLSPEFWAKRRRTAQELSAAGARGVVVVRLRGSRQARRWLADQERNRRHRRPPEGSPTGGVSQRPGTRGRDASARTCAFSAGPAETEFRDRLPGGAFGPAGQEHRPIDARPDRQVRADRALGGRQLGDA